MNRKERRAALKGGGKRHEAAAPLHDRAVTTDQLLSAARRAYQADEFARARDICLQILAKNPSNATAANLLGIVFQAQRQDKLAIRHLTKAIALEPNSAAHHYNIAFSHQRLDQWDDAVTHFGRAIALRLDGKPIEDFVAQYPVVTACLNRIAQAWPRRLNAGELFGPAGVAALADDAFLLCALERTEIASLELESFLGAVRYALLQQTIKATPDFGGVDPKALGFDAALAQQCFIGEYIVAQSDDETAQADSLQRLLVDKATAGAAIPPLLLVTVAAYVPLHRLPAAGTLRGLAWPPALDGLVRQQLHEPFAEQELARAIPSVTAIEDQTSQTVQRQYEDNPYPRWTTVPDLSLSDGWRTRFAPNTGTGDAIDVLVAGCGTGQHPIQTAQQLPNARILAIDLSKASLAYAQRKTQEAGITNIEYAQADILKLGSLRRTFDRIESIGVLHHMADPHAGWRVLLSRLKPGGVMDIGLYSRTARRAIIAARAMIAERSYAATADNIQTFRREIQRLPRDRIERGMTSLKDFYTLSGCRDLLFHAMEHQFELPEIASFLSENGLSFLGFRVGPEVLDRFRQRFPSLHAPTDLACWHTFEQTNPQTFLSMYRFAVRRDR